MNHNIHHAGCGCMSMGLPRLSRRGAIGLGFGGILAAAFPALAASGSYEAMLVNCIDPRFTTFSQAYMASKGMKDKFSHFVIAGGPIGIVSPKFADWQKAFWDNLAITVQLHEIHKVVGLTHRDCGAAAVAFGEAARPEFRAYAAQIVANAKALAAAVAAEGIRLVSGGTDNHQVLCDLRTFDAELTGKVAQEALDAAGITCNRNTIPDDPRSPFVTFGRRDSTS